MKKKIVLFAMLITGLTCISLKAQTGADYYLPLCTGNYVQFYTDGFPSGWTPRHTYYSIVRSDSIGGRLYYAEKGFEITVVNPADTNVFHFFWLRKDSVGNILAGAYDPTNTGVIDSAIISNPPYLWFPNENLTLGYSRSGANGETIMTDSVISISATVGTYTNCIQIRSTRRIAGTIVGIKDKYYAYHIGQVKGETLYPATDAHIGNLVGYVATDCYLGITDNDLGNANGINLYPNPASTILTIETLVKGSLVILNLNGQQLLQREISEPNTTIDVSALPSGVYFVQLTGERTVLVGKFVKQ